MSLLLCHHEATTRNVLWEVMVMIRRMYAVVFPARVDVFSESMAGVLDYHSSFPWEAQEKAPTTFSPGPAFQGSDSSEFITTLDWQPFPLQGSVAKLPIVAIPITEPGVYIAFVGESQGFEYSVGSALDSIHSPILGFLLRYPTFRTALDSSDFLTVAHMLVNSKELTAYHVLLRFLAGPAADYPVLWYFLHDQDHDKTAMVESYLAQHRIEDAHEYHVLFKFSFQLGRCRNLLEFQDHLVKLMAQKWKDGEYFWTEVTGLAFNVPGMGAYLRIVEDVMALERDNRLHNRCRADQFEPRILEVLSHLAPITVERELLNSYDAQAIAVYGTNYNGKRMRLGYLKQDMAHMLHRLGGYSTAKLALLDTDVMEILIKRES